MRRLAASTLALMLTVLLTSPASAAWPILPDVPGVLVSNTTVNENIELAISDGRGGAILTFSSIRSGSVEYYAQRVTSTGTTAWTPNGVRLAAAGAGVVGVSDGAGGVVIAWLDNTLGTANTNIRAQRVDSSGAVRWGPEGVLVVSDPTDQSQLVIAADGAGGAVLVWVDERDLATSGPDLYAQRVTSLGTAQWAAQGVPVCTATGVQGQPAVQASPAGGAVIAFTDSRDVSTTGTDIWAQRINSSGTRLWRSGGTEVCNAAGAQDDPVLVASADSGAFIAWNDARDASPDVYAQRLLSSGGRAWGTQGTAVYPSSDPRFVVGVCGSGDGAIVVTADDRTSDYDLYAQRMTGLGSRAWGAQGVMALGSPGPDDLGRSVHSDGHSGAIVVGWLLGVGGEFPIVQRLTSAGAPSWGAGGVLLTNATMFDVAMTAVTSDLSLITGYNVLDAASTRNLHALRFDARGVFGDPRPAITRVSDVLADQGGHVAVEWTASSHDCEPDRLIAQYSVWRDVPAALVKSRARVAKRAIRAEPMGAQTLYWEYVTTVPARARPGYSAVVATTTDSMPGSNPLSAYMVSSETEDGEDFWDSMPAMGYSIDNLAPATPAPFTGQYAAGSAALQWGANSEPDLAGYRLYRGSTPGFATGPASLVSALTTTSLVDAVSQPWFYKLTALDVHGNESPPALLQPQGVLDAPGGPRAIAHFAAPQPNPVRAGTSTHLRFGLATGGAVLLTVFDAQGREVCELLRGSFEPGEHGVTLATHREDGRRLAPGLYLVRLEGPGLAATRRVLVLP